MSATTIAATFRVTTPMFCGGANGQSAELRAAASRACCDSGGGPAPGHAIKVTWSKSAKRKRTFSAARKPASRGCG